MAIPGRLVDDSERDDQTAAGQVGHRGRAAGARRQRLWLDGRREALLRGARRIRRGGLQPRRHRRRVLDLRPGARRRRVRERDRPLARAPRPAGRRGHRDQGRHADGTGRERTLAPLHPQSRRPVAAPPEDRLHRPLSGAHRRQGNAARRDARRIRGSDRRGQSPRDRRVELPGRPPRSGARREQVAEPPALRDATALVQPLRPRVVRRRARGGLPAREARRDPVLRARERIPHGQIPHARRISKAARAPAA